MAEKNKTYDLIIKEVKDDLQKMTNPEIGLNEAIQLFEDNLEKLNSLKEELDKYKIKVQKVLANNKIQDFEE